MSNFYRLIYLIIGFICLTTYPGSAQTTFNLESFAKDSLPVCINYSYDEQVYFGAIYSTDTVRENESDSTYELEDVYETNDYEKDTTLILPVGFVKAYLMPDSLTENLPSEYYAIDRKSTRLNSSHRT